MENLNKENFFDQMKEKYPEAMEHFCNWIDDYKKKVDWDKLFNSGKGYFEYRTALQSNGGTTKITEAPKFHDLPFEMQLGIIIQYGNEVQGRRPHTPDLMMVHMTTILSSQQNRIIYAQNQKPK